MPDLFRMVMYWWKKLFLLALAAVVLSAVLLLLQPKLYLSVATALPANSATQDKARIFNPNVQHLYSALGSPDELDKFLGIAQLDILYTEMVMEHKLIPHYKVKEKNPVYWAVLKLRTRITVSRSKWNDLKIKAWDENPQMAALLANAFLAKAEALYQKLQQQNNRIVLQRLQQDLAGKEKQLQQLYTEAGATNQMGNLKLKGLEQQVTQLQQLTDEYTLSVQTPLPLLLVAETAIPSVKPDKPKILQTLAFVLFAALLFGFLVAVFIESRKQNEQQTI